MCGKLFHAVYVRIKKIYTLSHAPQAIRTKAHTTRAALMIKTNERSDCTRKMQKIIAKRGIRTLDLNESRYLFSLKSTALTNSAILACLLRDPFLPVKILGFYSFSRSISSAIL